MLEIGKFRFKTEVEYFQYVMDRYFRKIPPISTNIYLNLNSAMEVENRVKLASLCHFPSIINTLARDENYEVQEAARKNDFWILLGQLQDVLGFDKRERREFARQEVFRIILVLLMFEDDIDILREVLRNASISTRMITLYIDFLEKRGRGKKDQQILKEAERVLVEKKQRIVKAAEIRKSSKLITSRDSQETLLEKLADDDRVIRKAVHNVMLDIEPELLLQYVHVAVEKAPRDKVLNQFIMLTEILALISKREDLKTTKLDELNSEIFNPGEPPVTNVAEYFNRIINKYRFDLLDKAQEDLTDFQNILLLSNCHCDKNKKIRETATNIMGLDDIMALVNDTSTPQHLFKSILDILVEHPEDEVRKRVTVAYHTESERLWNRLKELEQSITAYFDIIFNSLGFTQINEYNISIKTLEQAERTIENLYSRFDEELKEKIGVTQSAFLEIKKAIEMEIYSINSDTSETSLKDLNHIADMIQQIIGLKSFGKEGLRPGVLSDIDPELLSKAHTIWQSALGQFLGRIKHLNEMVKIKFSILAREIEKHEHIQSDFMEIVETFEMNHKEKIDCTLKITCNQCVKRSCAAERFLTETEFFIGELIDNFVETEPA